MNESLSYLLIDTALVDAVDYKPWLKKKGRPAWVSPIYDDTAIVVSPVLIDIALAMHCDRAAEMMLVLNGLRPQLHISIIETDLTLEELTSHFRKFICVLTSKGDEFSLRFSDCEVLSVLSKELDQENWNAIVFPISRWLVHRLDGTLSMNRHHSSRYPAAVRNAAFRTLSATSVH